MRPHDKFSERVEFIGACVCIALFLILALFA